MSKRVTIARDVLAPETWQTADVDDVAAYLKTQFDRLPDHARIYHNHVTAEHDVTPFDAASIEHLQSLQGRFWVVCYPADPATLITIAVTIAVSVAVALLMPMPPIPDASSAARQGSSNNDLSQRANKARPNGRIPDIYGRVRSVPDLIAVPYSVYQDNIEIEHTVMCVGRGEFVIIDCYDDTTRIIDIAGASAQFYSGGVDIVTGTPTVQFGEQITDVPYQVVKSNSINGQTLRAPNDVVFAGENDIYCQAPNEIRLIDTSDRDFTTVISAGDVIIFSDAGGYQIHSGGYDETIYLNGTYTVLSVTEKIITLSNPAAVNAAWSSLAGDDDGKTNNNLSPKISLSADRYVGWFVLEPSDRTHLIVNVVAQNGLYKVKSSQKALTVTIEIEVQPIDASDTPTGASELHEVTLTGSSSLRDTVAKTLIFATAFAGRCRFRARRITETDLDYTGTIVDQVKIKDVYAASTLARTVYDGLTMVRCRTVATDGALAVKERKLNCEVQRRLPMYTNGSMGGVYGGDSSGFNAIIAAALDPKIGRRTIGEIDIDSFVEAYNQSVVRFGTTQASWFCYTFDSTNQSFEEIATTIAQAMFCEVYRQGSKIKIKFESPNSPPVLLFNHRNKVPRSEKRTVSFGIKDGFDGVEYVYTSPDDDSKIIIKVPSVATNPKKVEAVGVRDAVQAHFAAWRYWQKLKYQRESVEFEGLRESDLVIRGDRVLVADNTRTGTQDGEIVSQDGLVVTTSQQHTLDPATTYTMHLQLYDGSVDAIGVTSGTDGYHLVLARAPTLPLVLDADRYVHTLYMITASDDTRPKAFLVAEKSPAGRMTSNVTCINFDARYYDHDTDLINGLIQT